ncbi:glycosyltransferase family 4 protein [Nocardia stercoris]|uniref:Glycosyltransferase family 1 protein n=1 Tax=Nocardia stercoris TaxID=2483361 RepID=A0A3M2KTL5_9NOCA|nr:glycosyltransferase family 4 protein [Nocardia stercoris]RMI28451.1 glycosyltransferase family 1 protein [Nocardia stercoris]
MRILMIAPTYRPRTGGLETYLTTIAEALARDHDVSVLTNRDADTQPPVTTENRVRVLRASAFLRDDPANTVPWEAALFGLHTDIAELLAGHRFDVIHTHTQVALLVATMAGLGRRAPIVASFHETQPERDPLGRDRSQFILAACRPDRVLAGSEAFADQAGSFGYPRQRIRIVYHGVAVPDPHHTQPNRADLRQVAGVADDGILVSLVGRFKPRKGHHRLLAAYLKMAQREQVRLLLAGSCNSADTDYLDYIRRTATTGELRNRVTVLADCPDSTRDAVWSATDIATQPSEAEGLGLACIEAMHAGLPTVVADVRGLREVVTPETGLLVDTDDADAYAAALDTLAVAPTARSLLGCAGRVRARTVFGIDRAATGTLGVYAEAIAERVFENGAHR